MRCRLVRHRRNIYAGVEVKLRSVLSSPRRRRRLAKILVAAGVAAAAAALAYVFRPSTRSTEHFDSGAAVVTPTPHNIRLTPAMRAGINRTLNVFIPAAVARRNLPAAYDLVTTDMTGGMSRREWAKGDIPVVPYPVRAHSWTVQYAEPNDVTLDVLMQPTVRMRRKVGPLVVRTELVRRRGRWLVDSYLAQAVFSSESAKRFTIISHPDYGPPTAPQNAADKGRLGTIWFLVPALLLSLVLLVPLTYLLVSWRRNRRVVAEIEAGFRARGDGYNGADGLARARALDAGLARARERLREQEEAGVGAN
jgi:hypothetical protein